MVCVREDAIRDTNNIPRRLHLRHFMKFDEYFSFFEIVKTLCALRVKTAANRHQYQLYWSRLQIDRSANGEDVSPAGQFASAETALLPPRREWHRGKKESRKTKSASMVSALSIVRTVTGYEKSGKLPTTSWGNRLLKFYEEVRSSLSAGVIKLNPPVIKLVRKSTGRVDAMDETKRKSAYRSLAKFCDLHDRVLIGKTTTYLRDIFDSELRDCCYAFRRNGKRFSFRSAVNDLVEYRKRFPDKVLYVADCDVQKFFDVIAHDVISSAFDSFMQRVTDKEPDPRARQVLDAYLDVYSFPAILENCQDPEVIDKREYVARVPTSVLAELYPGENVNELRIGIPQGGALSPLLANIVMDAVDRAVLSDLDPDLFYARYCDDMVIVHPDKRKCVAALRRYLDAMELLKLPIHKLSRKTRYSSSYFTEKSKGPIAWKKTSIGLPGTNWVSFLGHQIRYDGEVRVRKETVQKHQDKIQLEEMALIQNLKRAKGRYREGVDWKDLLRVFQMRLTAIGVGRVDRSAKAPRAQSWLSVFVRNLKQGGPAETQLRNLDRTKGGVLASVKWILKSSWWNLPKMASREASEDDSEKKQKVRRAYFGAPFSYYGSLMDSDRPGLQDVEIEENFSDDIGVYSKL